MVFITATGSKLRQLLISPAKQPTGYSGHFAPGRQRYHVVIAVLLICPAERAPSNVQKQMASEPAHPDALWLS